MREHGTLVKKPRAPSKKVVYLRVTPLRLGWACDLTELCTLFRATPKYLDDAVLDHWYRCVVSQRSAHTTRRAAFV